MPGTPMPKPPKGWKPNRQEKSRNEVAGISTAVLLGAILISITLQIVIWILS